MTFQLCMKNSPRYNMCWAIGEVPVKWEELKSSEYGLWYPVIVGMVVRIATSKSMIAMQLNQGLIMEDIWKIITYLNIKIIVKCSLLVRKGSQEKLKLLWTENTAYQNYWYANKAVFRGALIALNVYILEKKRDL